VRSWKARAGSFKGVELLVLTFSRISQKRQTALAVGPVEKVIRKSRHQPNSVWGLRRGARKAHKVVDPKLGKAALESLHLPDNVGVQSMMAMRKSFVRTLEEQIESGRVNRVPTKGGLM